MNFLKHEAELVRRQIAEGSRDPSAVSEISNFLESALDARNQIVAANTRLAIFVAKKYATPSLPLHELVGVGGEGLIRAANFFDCDQGNKFSTYASTALFNLFARAAGKLLGGTRPLLLSEMKYADFPDPKAHSSVQDVEYRDLKENLGAVIAQLPPREALIIRQRFFEGATFQDVADKLGVSKQRVQQMQVTILRKLRELVGETLAEG
jgi:RNA polymerase sigma factor (sigma-70 family)